MDETKKPKVILLIFLILILIVDYLIYVKLFNAYDVDIFSLLVILYTIFNCLYVICLILLMPLFKIIEKLHIRNEENKIESLEYNYYREIVDNYSILLLSKCLNMKCDYKDVFVATLLKLELQGKIKIDDNEIIILNEENLYPSEQMLIKAIEMNKSGYATIYTKKMLPELLKDDLYQDNEIGNLFAKKDSIFQKISVMPLYMFLVNVVLFVVLCILPDFCFIKSNEFAALMVISILMLFMFLNLIVGEIAVIKFDKVEVLTKEGKNVKNKMIGLRNFINDFSLLNEKQIEEINLWNYYIIYAILFNEKGNLNDDSYLFFEKYISSYIK